jgi:urease accessory protein UreF
MVLALADSRLPIGGHVHSGGVEEAVASGSVRDAATVELYLRRRIRTAGLVAASLAAAVKPLSKPGQGCNVHGLKVEGCILSNFKVQE